MRSSRADKKADDSNERNYRKIFCLSKEKPNWIGISNTQTLPHFEWVMIWLKLFKLWKAGRVNETHKWNFGFCYHHQFSCHSSVKRRGKTKDEEKLSYRWEFRIKHGPAKILSQKVTTEDVFKDVIKSQSNHEKLMSGMCVHFPSKRINGWEIQNVCFCSIFRSDISHKFRHKKRSLKNPIEQHRVRELWWIWRMQ